MIKLIGSKLRLYNTLPRCFHYSSSTPSDSLFLRISRAGDPNFPVTRLLDQWVEEGRDIKHSELQFFVKQLRVYRRFNHALQVSEWMSNERNLHFVSGDIAIRLDLIAKVRGLDQAEKYFSSISDTSRDIKVYGALLNCYAQHNSVEKAEAIMQKIKEYASKHAIDLVVSYNVLLKLYARIGQYEKLDALMQEMKEKNIYNSVKLTTWLNVYVITNDIDGMEKVLAQMEADPLATVDCSSYISMLTALSNLHDIDGAERILEEWESKNTCFDIRIPNVMVGAYCKNGMLEKAEAYVLRLSKRKGELDGSIWDRLARGYYKCNDMDKAVETMKKAILVGKQGWRPYPFTLAACVEHVKDKGDSELALEILRICRERGTFCATTYDRLLSYVHGEISETNALNLMRGDYHLRTDGSAG
ncbi:Tetratricopeptide-like helical domain superfamily [Sesbania bispinosa]|nr:Tetratricopeptide-like helical domain superfamily [Sesbania bispinosa]